jgi:hypothetical protein
MKQSREAERAQLRQHWKEHIRRWKESGLSQSEYCRKHGLKANRFWYWKKRLMPVRSQASLVEVPLRGAKAESFLTVEPIYLTVNGNYRVEIKKGFDPASLEEIVRLLIRL